MDEVDQEWLHRELAIVVDDLARVFPSVPDEQIRSAVEEAEGALVPTATIAVFLPILIRRRAHARLRARVRTSPPHQEAGHGASSREDRHRHRAVRGDQH